MFVLALLSLMVSLALTALTGFGNGMSSAPEAKFLGGDLLAVAWLLTAILIGVWAFS